ncbi:hypothetical protein B0H13DRAFT_1514563, partial [Mycena leptocephala]
PPLPPGLTYLAALPPSINMLMIGTVGATVLVPMFIALLVFSTEEMRRKPVFILNVISVLAGFAMGVLSNWSEIQTILKPDQPFNINAFIAVGCMTVGLPICVESILLFRLLAVYPPSRTPRLVLYSIFGPLLLLKLGRIINAIIFFTEITSLAHQFPSSIAAAQVAWDRPGDKIEWILQVLDNSATSLLFIHRLQGGRSLMEMSGTSPRSQNLPASYAAKLKALFWISVSNFVFPVILSITQLIFRFRDNNYLNGTYIFFANNYVEIIGVLFATVWAAGTQ